MSERLTYGELMMLTEGHGTSQIYERVDSLHHAATEAAKALKEIKELTGDEVAHRSHSIAKAALELLAKEGVTP